MPENITKHTGVLATGWGNPAIKFVVLDWDTKDPQYAFFLDDDRGTAVHLSGALMEAADRQIRKDQGR